MMAWQQKDNEGSLWKNEKREKNTHPNLTGKIMVGGVMYYISAWTKEHDTRGKWLSLAVKPVEQKSETTSRRKDNGADVADDLPW